MLPEERVKYYILFNSSYQIGAPIRETSELTDKLYKMSVIPTYDGNHQTWVRYLFESTVEAKIFQARKRQEYLLKKPVLGRALEDYKDGGVYHQEYKEYKKTEAWLKKKQNQYPEFFI